MLLVSLDENGDTRVPIRQIMSLVGFIFENQTTLLTILRTSFK